LFHLRVSSHTYIESISPKTELIMDLIGTKSDDILTYNVGESAMLSMAKSAKSVVVCDETLVDFVSLNNIDTFTYKMFSQIMYDLVKNN